MPTARLVRRSPLPAKPSEALPPAAAFADTRPPAEVAARPPAPSPVGVRAELIWPATAAERLSVNAKVLERWRGTGAGPDFVRLSSKTIRYRPADLDAFVAGRVRCSTAA
jgi:hypothetical protein